MTQNELIAKIKAEARRQLNDKEEIGDLGGTWALQDVLSFLSYLEESEKQKEQQEVDLEKFTEKMDAWKARYNHPDNIPIKATIAFTARMFYMYPKVAREWYLTSFKDLRMVT